MSSVVWQCVIVSKAQVQFQWLTLHTGHTCMYTYFSLLFLRSHTLTQLETPSRPARTGTGTVSPVKPATQKAMHTPPQNTSPIPAVQKIPPSTNTKPMSTKVSSTKTSTKLTPTKPKNNQKTTPPIQKDPPADVAPWTVTPTSVSPQKTPPPPLTEQPPQTVKPKLKKDGGTKQPKRGKCEGGKKESNKSITIPSIQYPVS